MFDCIIDLFSCLSFFDFVKLWWDFFKFLFKVDIISYAKFKRKEFNRECFVLINRLINLKRKLVRGEIFFSVEILIVELYFVVLVDRLFEGVKIRSRV